MPISIRWRILESKGATLRCVQRLGVTTFGRLMRPRKKHLWVQIYDIMQTLYFRCSVMCLCYLIRKSNYYIQISEEQILSVSECADISEQSFPNLPRLCYDVYHLSKNVHSKLHCCIYAQRARTANGCTPRFIITSTPVEKIPITKNGN